MPSPYPAHRGQIETILLAWGMPKDQAARTADVLAWADLHGVDSHGISMIVEYDGRRRAGRLKIAAESGVVRESPVSALIDGGGGLGHVAYAMAADMAIAKAKEIGICGRRCATPRISARSASTPAEPRRRADRDGRDERVGNSRGADRGAEARLGTDPWSFAAPSSGEKPFLLDMATTTVAYGKIRNKMNEGQPMPVGWGLDGSGRADDGPARRDPARRLHGAARRQRARAAATRATASRRWSTS